MLGLVSVSDWLVLEALRNTIFPPLAFESVVVLTVAPLPVGDMLSASQVVDCALAAIAHTTVASRLPKMRESLVKPEKICAASDSEEAGAFMLVERKGMAASDNVLPRETP